MDNFLRMIVKRNFKTTNSMLCNCNCNESNDEHQMRQIYRLCTCGKKTCTFRLRIRKFPYVALIAEKGLCNSVVMTSKIRCIPEAVDTQIIKIVNNDSEILPKKNPKQNNSATKD